MPVSDRTQVAAEGDSPTPVGAATAGERTDPAWLSWLRGRAPAYGPPVYRRFSYLQVVVFAVIMIIVGAVFGSNDYLLGVMDNAFTYAIAAIGLYFAYSLGGMFAFSQAAFMGLGAYTSAKIGAAHGFLAGFLGAAVVCFAVACAVGFILRRARGLYFAVGALGVAELMSLAFANWQFLGGSASGAVTGINPPNIFGKDFFTAGDLFWFTLVVLVIVLLLSMLVERSPIRRNALAAKQIPLVASASGVPVHRVAIMLFAYGCLLAGLAGSIEAHSIGAITPDGFGVGLAIDLYLMVLLGGLRSVWGPVVGAIFYTWLPEWLRPVQSYEAVINSFLLLFVIVVLPEGIVGTLSKVTRGVLRRAQGH